MFESFIEENKEQMVLTLQQLLQIESVKGTPVPGGPFGQGPRDALFYMLSLAAKFGLSTENVDGYAGHVEFGTGDEYIAVLSHLDVVPAGSDWTYAPFAAEIHDGKIYARGAIDDKGPAMSSLWALIALQSLDIRPKRKIRLIFGLDEESNWACMDYYFKHQAVPIGGFTPDADFPLIYAEKGLATIRVDVKADSESMSAKVVQFEGGSRVNMVPDYAYAVVDCLSETAAQEWQQKLFKDARQKQIELDVNANGSRIQIVVHGISAHASHPEEGVNAITLLAQLLSSHSVSNGMMWKAIAGQDTMGKGLGIDCSDSITGNLTANLGKANLSDGVYHFYFNIRYPIDTTGEDILSRSRAYLSDKWHIELVEDLAPLYVPSDSLVVQTLRRVYFDCTRDTTEPLTIGGATYARAIPNAVAFGALFPGEIDLAHQKNECWELQNYFRTIQIYAQAMMELANTL